MKAISTFEESSSSAATLGSCDDCYSPGGGCECYGEACDCDRGGGDTTGTECDSDS